MKNVFHFLTALLIPINITCQVPAKYQTGLIAEKNLAAIGNLSPNSAGGMGFDERYQGVVGSPLIFDSLLISYLTVKGQDNLIITVEADINAFENNLIYKHPKTGKIFAITADKVKNLSVFYNGKEMIFRTTEDLSFKKPLKEIRFVQVLYSGKPEMLKMADKKFVEADYKQLYSVDRRYDEFITEYRYFINGPDSLYHQVSLTKKSINRIYSDKKDLLEKLDDKASSANDKENVMISILKEF
jgi:hypothetical protein